MFLLIDNYDSFTYNLAQAFYALGKKPVILKNDDPEILRLAESPDLEMVCISPGPGRPENAGLCPEFLRRLSPEIPVLGVCLGHQILGAHAGADVVIAPSINHGKQSEIAHDGKGIFKGVDNPVRVGRYHSLVVKPNQESENKFTVTARGPEGEVMALSYNDRPWVGVQFHPESVLTPDGLRILENFPGGIAKNMENRTSIPEILANLVEGKNLTPEMASTGFAALMDGELTPAQAGAFLLGLSLKGESPLELAHAVRAALSRSVRVNGLTGHCIDIVGTGGDGKHSFNCSTAASFVMAGLGYKVVKHGNRAVSSTCGAADVLEGLGIELDPNPETVLSALEKRGFAFLFAPYYHPSFKNIGPLRKQLGVRTLFNILGPMINPARPSHLLMGVAKPEMVDLVANTLAQSQVYRAMVVHGAGGYDEMTSMGPARIAMVQDGKVSAIHFDPADYGFKPSNPEDLSVASKEEAVAALRETLAGNGSRARLDMVALNVALALTLLEEDMSLPEAVAIAQRAVNDGVGMKVLENA